MLPSQYMIYVATLSEHWTWDISLLAHILVEVVLLIGMDVMIVVNQLQVVSIFIHCLLGISRQHGRCC